MTEQKYPYYHVFRLNSTLWTLAKCVGVQVFSFSNVNIKNFQCVKLLNCNWSPWTHVIIIISHHVHNTS